MYKGTHLTHVAKIFIENFHEQVNCLHHQKLIISHINSHHEVQAGIPSVYQLVVAVL